MDITNAKSAMIRAFDEKNKIRQEFLRIQVVYTLYVIIVIIIIIIIKAGNDKYSEHWLIFR